MERVAVVGCSGSGNTTLALALARALGAPHVELDSISHQPGWTRLNDDELRARHGVYRRCYSEAELDRRWAQLRFVRRRSQAEADGVVAGVTAATSKEE